MFQPKPLPTFPLPPPTAPDRRLVSYLPVSGRLASASGARAVLAAPVRRGRYPDDIVRHPAVFGIEATVLFLTCSIAACKETFKTEADRDHHLFTAHRVWGHNCPVEGCEFSFYSSVNMELHLQTHHEPRRRISCAQCAFSTKSYRAYRHHVALEHERGLFGCPFESCNIVAPLREDVLRHMQTHRKPNRFRCQVDECRRMYHSAKGLRQHQQRAHLCCVSAARADASIVN